MSVPGQQYRGMNYPASYPSSTGSMEPQQAGHFAGAGSGGPGPVTSVSGDTAGMQSANVGRTGSIASDDLGSADRSAQSSDGISLNSQQNVSGGDVSKDSNVPAFMEGNHVRLAGPAGVDENLGRQNSGMDGRPVYPMGTDGTNLRYGQPGMDVRSLPQKQMFGQMPSRSAPFMNMNGVAIRPGQLPFGPDGAQSRGVEGMGIGTGAPSSDSMPSRPDQPLVGPDGLQRRPGQSLPADGMFGRQGPPPFGMDGPGGRLGPSAGMDPVLRRAGHPVPDDGTMNRSGPNANMDTRASIHGMPVRNDESSDENFRLGPQMGPGSVPIRPGMENMPGRPLPQMGGIAEGMNIRSMPPQHPPHCGMDVMQGRPGQMRMDAVERRGGIPEGIGPHTQHPGYGHQYPGYGSHPASSHPGHGPPPSGFTAADASAAGDQMFRNHMPTHMHADGRGPVAAGSGGDGYRPGGEFVAEQRHFMANGDVDVMRRAADPPYAPKNFESGEYRFV